MPGLWFGFREGEAKTNPPPLRELDAPALLLVAVDLLRRGGIAGWYANARISNLLLLMIV